MRVQLLFTALAYGHSSRGSGSTICQCAVRIARDSSAPCRLCSSRSMLTDLALLWLQVLTVTGNHIVYKASDNARLSPIVSSNRSAALNATFAASFAARIPIPALNVKVCSDQIDVKCHYSAWYELEQAVFSSS